MEEEDLNLASLKYHEKPPYGKLSITPTKPLTTQRDLALAYSPGVAEPCRKISNNKEDSYVYTSKGNLVAVISNGTAVLGLGNIGALASKPVMEGKAALFKRFADIDAIDIEVDTEDIDEFVNIVKKISLTFGGINLEDIKSPECFIVEEKLKQALDIPVFHDDQHGTAVITLAALINASEIAGKKFSDLQIVLNGTGAAGIACIELIKSMGAQNIICCDQTGVIYKNRKDGMNPWKEKHAYETNKKTLYEALDGADVFLGLSVKDALKPEMLKSMAKNPIIFAMANPDPEINPELALQIRPDAIIATGRSDYPNQVNNVMGFPHIFRGALDARAKTINAEMKIAAAMAIANLARLPVHNKIYHSYGEGKIEYGKNYIIPAPFDPRLPSVVASAVLEAAIKTGVAKNKEIKVKDYRRTVDARLNPTLNVFNMLYSKLSSNKKTVIFTDGDEKLILSVASRLAESNYIKAIFLCKKEKTDQILKKLKIEQTENIVFIDPSEKEEKKYTEFLYKKLQRRGLLMKDCAKLIQSDKNTYASCAINLGDADCLITGIEKNYIENLRILKKTIGTNGTLFSFSVITSKGRTILIADTSVNLNPTAHQLSSIVIETAKKAKTLGIVPRVAFISHASFGKSSNKENTKKIEQAIEILKTKELDFEVDGEFAVEAALNNFMLKKYPFTSLSDTANILIMPSMEIANISFKLIRELSADFVFGPVLVGLNKSAQILNMDATEDEIQNFIAWAAIDSANINN